MAIKSSLGRLQLPAGLNDYIAEKQAAGFWMLPLEWHHAAGVEKLPFHHRDPFDRILAAQSLAENIPLVTGDPIFRRYGVKVVW